MLQTLVADWRAKLQQPSLAFGAVLLAAWKSGDLSSFPLLRLVQANLTSATEHTFVISAIDCGDPDSGAVHSPYKQAVGSRAAHGTAAVALGMRDAQFLGPSYEAARLLGPAFLGEVEVTFGAAGLYGKPIAVNASVVCPPKIPQTSCESFAILSSPDCVWHPAEARPSDGSSVLLRPQGGAWPANAAPVATRGYFANWPVVTVTNANGIPATPWLEYVDSAARSCSLLPPAPTPAPPAPPTPAPGPCNYTAPAGFKREPRQGWWANFTQVSAGGRGTVGQCAGACAARGPACLAFHVWEPCVDGDCFIYEGSLGGFSPHAGGFAYERSE
jgi:hypothetical protein